MRHVPAALAGLLLLVGAWLYFSALQEPEAPPLPARTPPPAAERPAPPPRRTPPPTPVEARAAPSAVATPAPVDPDRKAGWEKLTVSGRVVDDRGNPVAGAAVKLRVNGRPRSFKADEQGWFETPELPAGETRIWAERRDGALTTRSTPEAIVGAEAGGEFDVTLRLPSGRTAGIGVALSPHNEGARVSRVGPDSPARESGLRTGDVLVEVDGETIEGLSLSEIGDRIKGPEGTRVSLTVLDAEGAESEVLVERRFIERGAVRRRAEPR